LRGASAIADVLKANPDPRLRVYVIWEPVLETDWGTPSPTLTANVADPRAQHFWDPGRTLSAAYGGAANLDRLSPNRKIAFRMKDVIWDAALVYPPNTKWGTPAQLLIAPVFKFRDDLALALPSRDRKGADIAH